MKARLLSNWITTVLGVGILIYTMWMMSSGSDWQDMVGFFGMATLLLRSKDSLIGMPKDEAK